ncbi:MAG: hypothetical protein IJA64_07665 [Rikenellaceae bacterium]|nr:hypothetical protein [Rikenellaceae bacterium]
MKRFLNILLLLVVAVSLGACEADLADFDHKEDEFMIDYGTVLITNGNGWESYYIIRDDGIALGVFGERGYLNDTDNGSRVMINYNVLGDLSPLHLPESCKAGYAIQLNALRSLPCQQTIIGSEPTAKCSPVYVSSAHVGKSYLDLCFDYKSLDNKKHKFELYCPAPDDPILDLYLIHYGDDDKNNDGQMISSHRISFNIEALRSDEPRPFTLHWVGLEGADKGRTGSLNAR